MALAHARPPRRRPEGGELREGVDPDRVARFVVGACTGMQVYSQLATQRADLIQRVCDMWALLLPGIASAPVADGIQAGPERVPAS